MLNIFNLFLFLFALWALLMVSSDHISWLYTFLGLLSASFISVLSYKTKLINEKSELLYLSSGFYRHFFKIYFKNFFPSLRMLVIMVFSNRSLRPVIRRMNVSNEINFNLPLLLSSLNMTTGIFCLKASEEGFLLHCIDDKYFKKFNLAKTVKVLNNVNDDDSI